MKMLVAVDGSDNALRAVRYAAKLSAQFDAPAPLLLLYADPPLMRSVAVSLGAKEVERYHADNARHVLSKARAVLKRAKIEFDERSAVGDPAAIIAKVARSGQCDLAIMGSHGRSALKNLLLGSVTSKVIATGVLPVLVVR
ncbi:universal stress protein [Lysobacter enzymogenes]|uniref:universal stress protein n=1 Tax=Lysobacter enzymogenes TaxID=69 RepID=UPI00099DE158|nr:universal stress protein [Lysobacter enzymogenes]UZW61921.1 universal stress protein [Lysobacter enzymogenes]